MGNKKTRLERLVDSSPVKPTHFNIWLMSALGVFMDGLDLFIIAVALPLLEHQFSPNQWELGLLGAASPIGAIIGAILLGYLTDKMGRKKLYVGSMGIFIIFSFLSAIAWDIESLIVFRFLLGIGIGADYPISSTYLSEFMPRRLRSRAIISAFSFQALGALGGATLGLITLIYHPYPNAWRIMFALTILPAIIIGYYRTKLPESVLWLQAKNEIHQASKVLAGILKKSPEKIYSILKHDEHSDTQTQHAVPYSALFSKKYLSQTLLTSIPWFIMDICLYGVGVFSAVILSRVYEYVAQPSALLKQNYIFTAIRATTGAMFIDIFLVIGFISAIFAIPKLGALRQQNIGFIGMTFGLLILGVATSLSPHNEILVFVGFSIFNLMVNFGPNPTTYMLPTERFPPHIRATGHGFAASAGKVGAAIGILFLPVCIHSIGIAHSMYILAGFALLGFLCTIFLGRKPTHA